MGAYDAGTMALGGAVGVRADGGGEGRESVLRCTRTLRNAEDTVVRHRGQLYDVSVTVRKVAKDSEGRTLVNLVRVRRVVKGCGRASRDLPVPSMKQIDMLNFTDSGENAPSVPTHPGKRL